MHLVLQNALEDKLRCKVMMGDAVEMGLPPDVEAW